MCFTPGLCIIPHLKCQQSSSEDRLMIQGHRCVHTHTLEWSQEKRMDGWEAARSSLRWKTREPSPHFSIRSLVWTLLHLSDQTLFLTQGLNGGPYLNECTRIQRHTAGCGRCPLRIHWVRSFTADTFIQLRNVCDEVIISWILFIIPTWMKFICVWNNMKRMK